MIGYPGRKCDTIISGDNQCYPPICCQQWLGMQNTYMNEFWHMRPIFLPNPIQIEARFSWLRSHRASLLWYTFPHGSYLAAIWGHLRPVSFASPWFVLDPLSCASPSIHDLKREYPKHRDSGPLLLVWEHVDNPRRNFKWCRNKSSTRSCNKIGSRKSCSFLSLSSKSFSAFANFHHFFARMKLYLRMMVDFNYFGQRPPHPHHWMMVDFNYFGQRPPHPHHPVAEGITSFVFGLVHKGKQRGLQVNRQASELLYRQVHHAWKRAQSRKAQVRQLSIHPPYQFPLPQASWEH